MGSSPLTLKAGVSDFCNIVCQGFPGQHARTVFVTPSGCLAAGWGQDGACPSPDTPFGSLAPPCPRLPPCIPGGQALAGAWEGAGRVVGEVRPAQTLPPASHSPGPLEAAPAMSSCGLSHAGLRATRAAADAGRAFLGPVPRSREPRGAL